MPMSLDLPDGNRCFVDANILYYHFIDTPPLSDPCTTFLERAASGNIQVYTSLRNLSDAVRKVMLTEAATMFGRNRAGLVNWLQRNQHRITELSFFRHATASLSKMVLPLLPADAALIEEGANVSAQFGLLTNDALIVALMRRQGLTNLVTNDDDFDAIPGLTIWKPRERSASQVDQDQATREGCS
jgi:predicted nucleic acid-binding protein